MVTMRIIFEILVLQSLVVAVIKSQYSGPMPQKQKGCHLDLNNGYDEMEPEGYPLLIHVRIRIFHLRDVPDSGGSFGVNTK